jgi:hypothetical protein
MQLILTVKVLGKLRNERNAAEGVEPCPPAEVEVRITFAEDDEQRLRMAIRDLQGLGFTHDDISLLHPDHQNFVSLVGKEIWMRMRVVGGVAYWNLAWPPEIVGGEPLRNAASSLMSKIAAVKRKQKVTSNSKDNSSGTTSGQPAQPETNK